MSKIESKITSALKKTLNALEILKEADAKSVADETGREYGRESSYLNTLARMGLVEKRRAGHQTLFAVKSVPLTILRLGGSVITFKDRELAVNIDAIKRLSAEIANALKSENGPKKLIVVFGGGSFGHPLAREYNLSPTASPIETKGTVEGLSQLQHRLIQLTSIVIEELLLNKVPAIPIELQGGVYQLDGSVDISLLTFLLNIGFVPVLHACALIDYQKNVRIISGDELIYTLAGQLKPSRVVVGTDVDGVYPEDPKASPTTKVIEELHADALDTIEFGPTKYVDVTAGMLGKARWMFDVTRLGIEVKLVNGLKPHYIEKALCGERVLGTLIKA